MPQRRTGIKDLRQNARRRLHNLTIKTDLKKTIKKFLASVTAKNKSEAQTALSTVFKKLDKACKRNILHKNTASRRKSLYSRMIATLN